MTFREGFTDPPIQTCKPEQWIVGPHVGLSSKTIWSALMGVEVRYPYTPRDPSDFGRCWRLLQCIPEWREKLHVVSEKYPEWKPFINAWEELETLWYQEWEKDSAPRMYARMKELEDAA